MVKGPYTLVMPTPIPLNQTLEYFVAIDTGAPQSTPTFAVHFRISGQMIEHCGYFELSFGDVKSVVLICH